ncbi:MAG: 6-phosphogluconolactonase [Actinomycetota bacterium]|nr:6-phosphogluconolactonase [Actinomycetota bacterium]
MTFSVRTWSETEFAEAVAETIGGSLPQVGTFVLTGGGTAARVYGHLARRTLDWSGIQVFFSDERCVPPTDDSSNYKMVREKLLTEVDPAEVFRIHGEDEPDIAAQSYGAAIAPAVADGFDLMMLGMGAEGHIGAMFPGSAALTSSQLCAAVERPDGMNGVTMTPPAMASARKIFLVVTGSDKSDAVARAVNGHEVPHELPVRSLAEHPDATFLLDEPAASRL